MQTLKRLGSENHQFEAHLSEHILKTKWNKTKQNKNNELMTKEKLIVVNCANRQARSTTQCYEIKGINNNNNNKNN